MQMGGKKVNVSILKKKSRLENKPAVINPINMRLHMQHFFEIITYRIVDNTVLADFAISVPVNIYI